MCLNKWNWQTVIYLLSAFKAAGAQYNPALNAKYKVQKKKEKKKGNFILKLVLFQIMSKNQNLPLIPISSPAWNGVQPTQLQ